MNKYIRKRRPRPADFAKLQGVWRSRGYGKVLEIGRQRYTLYEETAVSCLPVFEDALDELCAHYADLVVSPRRQTFSVRRAAGVTRLSFRRLKTLPQSHGADDPETRRDPVYNFEVLWRTFAEHYALFDVRNVDWEAAYEAHRPQVSASTPPERLFEIFVAMLHPLRDGHVQLHTPHGQFNAGAWPPLYDRLAAELERADDERDVPAYLADLREWLWETIHEEYLEDRPRRSANRLLEWGRLDNAMGYIAIRAMAGQSGKVGRPQQDLEAVDRAMAQIMAELGELPAIVVDVRSNAGGYDIVALRLASYFTDRKRLAFKKAARNRAGTTGALPIYVEPHDRHRYTGRLMVLTSGLTSSAAEIFLLALLRRPELTRIGEATHGILSDAFERHLPNGWFVTLSNELYLASDGRLYEDCGVPPHVDIPFLAQRSREEGRDEMLDYIVNASREPE